jgi:seryl-tRNA synthetase
MLDLKFVRDNLDLVRENTQRRKVSADVDRVISLYDERNKVLAEIEALRKQRNENAARMKGKLSPAEREPLIEEGRRIKEQLPELESRLESMENKLTAEAEKIPNLSHPDAPVGSGDEDNVELRKVGTIPDFTFPARDHVELAQSLDLVDFDTASRVSGTKFYYLRNQAVFLELGLIRYALDIITSHGFTPTATPDIAREEVVRGIGFNPRGEESNIYTLEGDEGCLVGTAEITLGGYYQDHVLEAADLPIKLGGISHCFRREAGAAGKYSKGLYRVHQFSKLEMFVYCLPSDSEAFHEELLSIEEEIFRGLQIPYRVVDTCTGELGGPAYRKYDIEAWMPGRGEKGDWGEVTSASNCTDYQARRLSVRVKGERGNEPLHMLNGTAMAASRGIIALLENHQQADGSIRIPEKLVPYVGFSSIEPRS